MSMIELFGQYMTESAAEDLIDGLRSQVAELQRQLDAEVGHVNSLKYELGLREEELNVLRAKKFARFNNEDCWIFQGDDEDNLESLTCPVVVKPARLIELLDAESQLDERAGQNPVAIYQYRPHFMQYGVQWTQYANNLQDGDMLYALPPNLPAMIEQARAEEREACAKMCEVGLEFSDGKSAGRVFNFPRMADAIRAREGK